MAGSVRVVVRALDDGGDGAATDPDRCAANARRAVADPSALAVVGTYELTCSERALAVLRPAGIWLVSPVNAADAAARRAAARARRSATRAPRPRSSRTRSAPRASRS